ncbi:MAG: amidohydrolase [Candidatus Latescibacterota bacterium]|nr:MAG: amidohydrolase [Candidatus Latescibacterota bacterium]
MPNAIRGARCAGANLAIVVLVAAVAPAGAQSVQPADLLLVNGKIVTVDATIPEAQALGVRDGRIVCVGTTEEIAPFRGEETTTIDLQGRLVVPGIIEAHGHFVSLGSALLNVDLNAVRTWDDAVERVAAAAAEAEPGEWILGRGWHQEKWEEHPSPNVEGYPIHESLSEVTPDNPVLLRHASGHASIVNEAAMRASGIHESTPDPPGGKILRDMRGHPTGVLRETAQSLAQIAYAQAQERLSEQEREARARREMRMANAECLANGVTSFQDAGSSFETVDRMLRLYETGELDVRLWVMLRETNGRLRARMDRYRILGAADERLTVRAIKRSMDGALGSHGAWLLEPYSDQPTSTGHNTTDLDSLAEAAQLALEKGFQVCVHAIGDRANRETLDLFERTFERNPGKSDLRWRVEHAQHLSRDDIPRFAALGVIASMQGVHCTSDGPWVPLRLGDARAADGAYVWRKLIESGARLCNGTDVPVEKIDPIANFYATVTRRTADGAVFYADQRMTRMEALESCTLGAAYAAFEEDIKGSLSVGKLADAVVLSRDILTVPEAEILDTRVDITIIGGEIEYVRPGAATSRASSR